ncbi:response regulator [Algoriphagus mannitolivorans]|uniref:response regulator n=1 Tax=Algoriphagus mannitolivorans TaxID=226504 RepID=UPI000409A178|nr:response regulator [Algoriphagus mannitolivorans]
MVPINIFLIEDNEGDIMLIQEGFDEAKIKASWTISRNGADAISELQKMALIAPESLPDLILMDINLPKKNGHEVLTVLKNDTVLKKTPIIVLTSSSSEQDISKAYDKHANCYIVKPLEIAEFGNVVQQIENFWLSVVKLPNKKAS